MIQLDSTFWQVVERIIKPEKRQVDLGSLYWKGSKYLIYKSLPQLVRFKIKLPLNEESQSFISWIYEKAHVLDITYDENVILSIECNNNLRTKILFECKKYNGSLVS